MKIESPLKTLRQIPIGGRARVVRVGGEGPLRRRLLDMGITKGVILQVLKSAPLGDPVEISLRGYRLSLRKSEGDRLQLDEIS